MSAEHLDGDEMNPHPPDDPWDDDERAIGQFMRSVLMRGGAGQTNTPGFANWALGLFGALIVVMLGFVLNAVYTTNGDIHELKGQNQTLQTEVASLRNELNSLSQQVGVLNGARHQ